MERDGIFPTFFLSGFECSTFLWGEEKKRRDLSAELQHYVHADGDYAMLTPLGIAVAREGVPWPLVDRGGGEYGFSPIDGFLAAQRRHKVLPIWDLYHYGYRDGLDPFGDADGFVARFTAYAQAAARYVAERAHHEPLCFTPINEQTFWGYMGEWSWCAPYGRSREDRLRFTAVLARADIAACKAIREDFPQARFVHIDPLIWSPRRATGLDEDPYDEPVDLADVIAAAKELAPKADADWS